MIHQLIYYILDLLFKLVVYLNRHPKYFLIPSMILGVLFLTFLFQLFRDDQIAQEMLLADKYEVQAYESLYACTPGEQGIDACGAQCICNCSPKNNNTEEAFADLFDTKTCVGSSWTCDTRPCSEIFQLDEQKTLDAP